MTQNDFRIGDIEYIPGFNNEIVCWYPNPHYGKEKDYSWTPNGEFAYPKENPRYRIHKDCFKRKEICCTIAFVEGHRKDDEPDIRSVGSRFLKLSEKDIRDYLDVCRMIYREVNNG